MIDNVVSLASRPSGSGGDTTVVAASVASPHPPLAQLRVPLRSLEEFELHITLIEGVLAKCRASVGRARRNHRHSEALLICGHELKQLNRMLNVKRHTTGGKKPV